MDYPPLPPHEQGLTAVIGWPHQDAILELVARLALSGSVRVLVGGNRFDAHHLARQVRRHTTHLDETLARIHLARPFTCYQTITLLEQTAGDMPLVCLDLLATFYDDAVSLPERIRLTRIAVTHLRRCRAQVPVLVTLRPPPPSAADLTPIVQAAADQVYRYTPPPTLRQLALLRAECGTQSGEGRE